MSRTSSAHNNVTCLNNSAKAFSLPFAASERRHCLYFSAVAVEKDIRLRELTGNPSREQRKLLCERDPKPRRSVKRLPNVSITDFVMDIPSSQPNTPSTSIPPPFPTHQYPAKHRLAVCISRQIMQTPWRIKLSRTQPNLPATSTAHTDPPILRRVLESEIEKCDAEAAFSIPQQVSSLHKIPCAPLMIEQRTRKNSHPPSQILKPGPSKSPTQHPDMVAMLRDIDELASWIENFMPREL